MSSLLIAALLREAKGEVCNYGNTHCKKKKIEKKQDVRAHYALGEEDPGGILLKRGSKG